MVPQLAHFVIRKKLNAKMIGRHNQRDSYVRSCYDPSLPFWSPRVHTSVQVRISYSLQTQCDTFKNSFVSSPRRSRMFQELHGSQGRPQDAGLPWKIPQQPGMHLYDLCPQDVGDHSGVWQLRHGARHHATAGRPLPIRLAGNLGRLPCRWGWGRWD